jgi:hypothetical protein
MITTSRNKSIEIEKRAAKIRGGWSAVERRRRVGLPPDAPAKLRDYILGSAVQWPTVLRVST